MASQEPDNRSAAPRSDAVEALRRRLAEDPRSLAFVSLAEELNRLRQHEEAAAVAQRGLLTHPDSVAGRLALAVAEAERDNIKEALEQIKRALIIDQENPRALALMGQILLKRGLAKRAVQFLSHAVKLAPTEPSYGALLQQARRQAQQGDAAPRPPVFDAKAVPAQGDPWADDAPERAVEHTVFDPDSVNRLTHGGPGLRASESLEAGEEPTAYYHPIPQPSDVPGRKAKMGGSAAELSQMMRAAVAPDPSSEAEPTVAAAQSPLAKVPPAPSAPSRAKAPPSAPSIAMDLAPVEPTESPSSTAGSGDSSSPARSGGASAVGSGARPRAPVASAADAGSARPAVPKAASQAGSAGSSASAQAKASPKRAKPKADPAPRDASAAKSKPAVDKRVDKRVGPAATRMVDDALWALFGKRGASNDAAETGSDEGDDNDSPRRAPVRARLRGRGDAPEPHKPRVVRTSERFGTWAQVATITVLSVAGAFIGHWIMLSSAGPGPEVASEEVKGLASDLERGGLASLLSAEEKAAQLARSAPDLAGLLHGVNAEIYARRWHSFGRASELREKARAELDALGNQRPTVEHLAALVALSTSAVAREPIAKALEGLQERYPDSPKIWALKAKLHAQAGLERAALNALFEARALHPQHRLTMLELARWYQRAGAAGAALRTYERLLERYPLDVEAAIERYVLGQVTGTDPEEAQAVSLLAGLVRNEDPAVAKDETGRASLAFAVPMLARGKLVDGIRALGDAEAAFDNSAVYKVAVAGVYLAVGEFDRAEALYEQAIKLEPDNRDAQLGLARARFAKAAKLKVDLTRESEKIAEAFSDRRGPGTAEARLPLGTVRLVPGRFELVTFEADPAVFPEDAYAEAADVKDAEGLEAVNQTALGDRALAAGQTKDAIRHFEAALGRHPSAKARFGLGRAQLAEGDNLAAVRTLQVGLAGAPDNMRGRLLLARALLARGQKIEALDVLEPLDRSVVVAPDGLLWLGRLRMERGDYEGAERPLRTVAELRPNDAAAHIAYGEVLHRLRRASDAEAVFATALEVQDDAPLADSTSAVALMYLGRAALDRAPRRGVLLLRRALEHEEVPVEAHFYLGRHLVKSRRTRREGRRELQRYARIAPAGELREEADRLLKRL